MIQPPEILPDVTGQIKAAIEKEIKIFPPTSNWASRIGHPCMRYLVHSRLDWDKTPKISVEKKMMFDLGHVLEQHVAKIYLEKAGYKIVEMDRAVQDEPSGLLRRVKLHGKLDFVCQDPNGWEFPVECKGVHPNTWNAVDSIEDLLFAKHVWTRQYPGQLMVYLLGKAYPIGMFIMINKVTAEPKHIWLHQDYTYAEELIQKAEKVNAFVDAGTYPDRINYDESICGRCDFAEVCLPDLLRSESEVIIDEDFINMLEERERLKPAAKRYEEVDEAAKKRVRNLPRVIAGNFAIFGKEVVRKNYARGPEIEPTVGWKVDIKRLEGISNVK